MQMFVYIWHALFISTTNVQQINSACFHLRCRFLGLAKSIQQQYFNLFQVFWTSGISGTLFFWFSAQKGVHDISLCSSYGCFRHLDITRQKKEAFLFFFSLLTSCYFWAKEKNYRDGCLEMANTRPNSNPCENPRCSNKQGFWIISTSTGVSWPHIESMIWFITVKDGVVGFLTGLFMTQSLQALWISISHSGCEVQL